jgi:hypothetical protein
MLAQHWLLVAREIIPKISSNQRLAFFASQPYKYLPTSLFTLSFRAKYAKKLGMGLKDSSKAQIIENINMVGTALTLAGVLLLFFWSNLFGIVALASLGFFAVILWKNHHITIHIFKTGIKFHMRCWLKAVGWCLMAWSVIGCGLYVLAASLEPNVNIFKSIAASSLATGSGMLVIIAPGGIGVREAVFASFGVFVFAEVAFFFADLAESFLDLVFELAAATTSSLANAVLTAFGVTDANQPQPSTVTPNDRPSFAST